MELNCLEASGVKVILFVGGWGTAIYFERVSRDLTYSLALEEDNAWKVMRALYTGQDLTIGLSENEFNQDSDGNNDPRSVRYTLSFLQSKIDTRLHIVWRGCGQEASEAYVVVDRVSFLKKYKKLWEDFCNVPKKR